MTTPDTPPTRSGRPMPPWRLVAYMLLAGWAGSLTAVAWDNTLAARWVYLASNAGLLVAIAVALLIMASHDRRRGRLAADRPDT